MVPVKTIIKSLQYRGLLALLVTAILSVGVKAPAQQPSAPVPSIEELKRQLEAKRLEAKRQAETKQQPDAKQQLEAKHKQPKSSPPEGGSAATSAPPRASALPGDVVRAPPIGKNISPVRLEPNSAAVSDSCPYPAAALSRGDTGTVVLLIFVAPDGRATDTKIETSSGSDVLDEAAASCVQEFGHFLPKRIGTRAEPGWFRMKFRWSFGD
jgi:TonB family protein